MKAKYNIRMRKRYRLTFVSLMLETKQTGKHNNAQSKKQNVVKYFIKDYYNRKILILVINMGG